MNQSKKLAAPRAGRAAGVLDDVLALLEFPAGHRVKLHSTKTLERWSKAIKLRANLILIGIFPNEASIRRLIGAAQLEQNEEWQRQFHDMTLRSMAETPEGSSKSVQLLCI